MADNKEEVKKDVNEENMGIRISDDVIAVIAGKAASEVEGVSEMVGGFAGGISEVLIGRKNLARGIKVEVEENNIKIDVNITVEYGARIPDVAFQIQKRVEKAVETMTGMSVSEVNVHVQGVNMPEPKKEKKEKENNKEVEKENKEKRDGQKNKNKQKKNKTNNEKKEVKENKEVKESKDNKDNKEEK